MKYKNARTLLSLTAPLLMVAACGESTVSIDPEPDTGAASAVEQTTAISGRVADGYIQGATICVDINENGDCDSDEPQTISISGGVYSLDIPDDASDKPILALVPPTAIDEDTGQAIGKELQFSSPGDKPSFLSPITTLVHQELKNNPSLTTEDAEAAMLETLGLPDEADVSLFADYVANSDTDDSESSEKFHYLHQTARVIATMMGEIQEDVLAAAEEGGLDVSGDPATKAAILQLVQDEINALLPEISSAVADHLAANQEGGESDSTGAGENQDIDPDTIADNLIPEDVSVGVVEQIDAIKAENPAQEASMKTLLSNGFYILDVDCKHDDEYGPEDGIDDQLDDNTAVILNDDGSPGLIELPEYCEANYSHIALDGDTNELLESEFYYDANSAQWIKESQEDDGQDDRPDLLVLKDGQWQPMSDDGPSGVVDFTSDGAAILESDGGKLLVYATKRVLDETSVQHHLLGRGAEDSIIDLIEPDAVFTTNSDVYRLNIKRDSDLTVLFNWYPEESDDGIDQCAQYAGNCNVVGLNDLNGFTPVKQLATIQEGSINGIVINDMVYDEDDHYPIDVRITADESTNNTMPQSGSVTWIKGESFIHIPEEFDEWCEEEEPADSSNIDQASASGEEQYNTDKCGKPDGDPTKQQKALLEEPDKTLDSNGTDSVDSNQSEKVLGNSQWKIVVENGMTMIEIEIPVAIRHRMDQDEMASLLLIEQNEFVRRGARFGARSVDDEVGYSQAAFETLKPIIEAYVGH